MHLLLLMVGILLLPEASTLRCYMCRLADLGTCMATATETECPQGQRCAATRDVEYEGDYKVHDQESKGCAMAEECIDSSINLGISQSKVTTKCCTTPLCNKLPVPEPSKLPNGKQCYYCDERTCTNILNCKGHEDYCISGTDPSGQNTLKGCLTKELSKLYCTQGQPYSCCEGNLCNAASSFSAGLVLLAAPLLSLLVISY